MKEGKKRLSSTSRSAPKPFFPLSSEHLFAFHSPCITIIIAIAIDVVRPPSENTQKHFRATRERGKEREREEAGTTKLSENHPPSPPVEETGEKKRSSLFLFSTCLLIFTECSSAGDARLAVMCQAGGRGSEKKKKKKNNLREGSLLLTLSRSRHAQLRDGLRLFCTFFLSVLHLDGSKSSSRVDMRRGKGGEAPEQRRNLKLVNGNRAFDSFYLSLSHSISVSCFLNRNSLQQTRPCPGASQLCGVQARAGAARRTRKDLELELE